MQWPVPLLLSIPCPRFCLSDARGRRELLRLVAGARMGPLAGTGAEMLVPGPQLGRWRLVRAWFWDLRALVSCARV